MASCIGGTSLVGWGGVENHQLGRVVVLQMSNYEGFYSVPKPYSKP